MHVALHIVPAIFLAVSQIHGVWSHHHAATALHLTLFLPLVAVVDLEHRVVVDSGGGMRGRWVLIEVLLDDAEAVGGEFVVGL